GAPRRIAQGLDANRVAMLLAAGNRHAGVSLQEHDVFVNVVGGIEIGETSADLPVLIALTSSLKGQPLPAQLVAFGEIGLTGEGPGCDGWLRARSGCATRGRGGFVSRSCPRRMRRAPSPPVCA